MARELPTGTVTLLFSDVEASTRMVHALGDEWAQVLEQQRRLCRRAWERHDGVEMGTEGDSFFVVFASPQAAVAAGLRAQASIAAATWPSGATVRIRVGIHTGTPSRHADGYVGMDVHRAARVAAAAHGGQLLATDATLRLVADRMPASVTVRDLGEHQLKDIPSRTRLHQLSPAGQEPSFPPPRTLGGAGNLTASLRDGLAEVVGRDGEVATAAGRIAGGVRLLTLTGPGGAGKTTLATAVAAQVADRYPDGVYVVPLVGVTSGAGMWAAMSQVLDVPPDGQVPPAFFDHLAGRRMLVVLDNLEQIDDADHVVRELLAQAAHVTVVATSRRALHVTGEHEHAVSGLALPDAVSMFELHAARARRGFAVDDHNRGAVEDLCAALDRLPLAIEITAARVKVLSPQAILGRMDRSLDLGTGDRGRDDRQATLRGAIAWSYDLLDPVRRAVLDHLGVFVGGASLEAIEAVAGPALGDEDLLDVLFDLVDQSMVVAGDTADGEPRFHLLETMRRFALDRLDESGGRATAEQRHAQHHLDLVRRLLHEVWHGDYRTGRETFLLELPNVDALLDRVEADVVWDGVPVPTAHRSALAAEVAERARLYEDARQWCVRAVREQQPDTLALAWLEALEASVDTTPDRRRGLELATSAYARVEGLADDASRPWRSVLRVRYLAAIEAGFAAAYGDNTDLGLTTTWVDRVLALARETGEVPALMRALVLGAQLAKFRDDVDGAWELMREVDRLRREAGIRVDPNVVNNLADLELERGRADHAQARLAEHLPALLDEADPETMAVYAETMGAVVAASYPLLCARTYAAVSVFRVVEGLGDDEYGLAQSARVTDAARALVSESDWERAWAQGLAETITDVLGEMARSPVPAPGAGST